MYVRCCAAEPCRVFWKRNEPAPVITSAPAETPEPTQEPVPSPTPDPRPGWRKWTWEVWMPLFPCEDEDFDHTIQDQPPCHIFMFHTYDKAEFDA